MKTARTLVVLFTGALFGAVNCKQVLSIEDAELDPSLTTGGNAGAGGDGGGNNGGTSGNAGTSGTAGDGGGAGGRDGGFTSLCDRYCTTLEENCAGEFAVYQDRDACMATCANLDEGVEDDRGVNTVHCRILAAEQAEQIEKEFYCPRAGPGGSAPEDPGPCATNCESLCLLMERVCNDADAGADWFTSREACLTECGRVPDQGRLSAASTSTQLRGNSVQCRLIHVANAALEPVDHCGHAAGATTCVQLDGG